MYVRKLVKRNFINEKKAEIQTLKKNYKIKENIELLIAVTTGAGRGGKIRLRDVGKKKKKSLKGKKIYLL